MSIKRILRYFLYVLGFLLTVIILCVLVTVIPVDRTPIEQKAFYPLMMSRLDSVQSRIPQPSQGRFVIGYDCENLTPPFPVATAGYGNRRGKDYTSVHDSIFVRTLVISNGVSRVALVSADMLIIPPEVTRVLGERLPSIGFSLDNTYLNATHTHNSIGNWGKGAAQLIYGSYKDTVVNFVAEKIVRSIAAAAANGSPSTLRFGTIAVPDAVRNRINGSEGGVDSLLRVMEVHREDSSKLVMVSFNAHATCLFSKDLELSRDYPGEVVDGLERKGYDFAMFISGAVGSHGCNPPEYGKPCLTWMADEILSKFTKLQPSLQPVGDSAMQMFRVPLALGEPQIKISKDWRLRPWVFRRAFGEYDPFLSVLLLGDMVFLGTPCDFSGEIRHGIDSAASYYGKHAVITSFNGQYVGYITKDSYYDSAHYETRLMNWYGPGNGKYFSECMIRLVEIACD
jgi:neutral ceramidase